jgi:hypothetical protein
VLFFIARLFTILVLLRPLQLAIELKFKLDTKKATTAAIAIMAAHRLCRVSSGTKFPQLATANSLALIIIIVILYGPRPAPTKSS